MLKKLLIPLFLVAVCPAPAGAHPHQWLDYSITLRFDAEGRLGALGEKWLFDTFYAQLMLPEYDTNGDGQLDNGELEELAAQNLANLADYNYFTTLSVGGAAQKFGKPVSVRSYMEQGRIAMEFDLPLAQPVSGPVSYAVYDPSYYIEMKHFKEGGIRIDGRNASACAISIVRPNPDAAYVAMAGALDKNAVAPENLGAEFTEKAKIECPL